MFKYKYSAGAVLLDTNNRVFLIHKIDRDEWAFPKGTVEEGEDIVQTALREVKEETGFQNISLLTPYPIYISQYSFFDKNLNEESNKYVSYFICITNEINSSKTKEMESEGLEGLWLNYEDAFNKLSFEEAKETLKEAKKFTENINTKLFLLGGNGIKNLEWIKKAASIFESKIKNHNIIYYNHWTQIEKLSINIESEAKKLSKRGLGKDNYLVFAKSAGIMTTLKSIKDYGLKPQRCVFVGFPISFLSEYMSQINHYLENINFPVIFFQNTNDPYSGFEEVKKMLTEVNNPNISIIEEIGDTHDYNNFDKYLEALINK